jgi:hypothetical protein
MSTVNNTEAVKTSVNKTNVKTFEKASNGQFFMFGKQNYQIMFVGLAVIILGFVLMAGGKSADPNVFKEDEIYSFQRITLAPFLVIAGLVIEAYAIMKKPKID